MTTRGFARLGADRVGVTSFDWRTAFRYMARDPAWKGRIFIGGLWMILFPVGWLIALGYRKAAVFSLIESPDALLPEWKGRWHRYLADGLRASGVILCYFTPFVLVFWGLALDGWRVALDHPGEIVVFALVIAAVPPLGLPLLPVLYVSSQGWLRLTAAEATLAGALFVATTFLMPAAFLQVSLHTRFRAAFRLDRVLAFVTRNARRYVYAWMLSLAATAVAGLLGPGVFWGIFWSYLVIVYTFNDVLYRSDAAGVEQRFRDSYFARAGSAGYP